MKAAAGGAGRPGALQSLVVGAATARALSIPTISRARDLITSMVASLDFRTYRLEWDEASERYVKRYVPGESWMTRPDPKCTRNFMIANLTQDLLMHGRGFWYVTSRYQGTGFPASFVWLPADNVTTTDQAGPEWYGPSDDIQYNGVDIDPTQVVQFLSPVNGLLWQGERSIDIAYRLDEAARRFANSEIAAGVLQQVDGEPLSGDELSELASAWADARRNRAIGALNSNVKWVESTATADKLQMLESRQYQALELARVANIPPYLVGVDVGGYTYQNIDTARRDLYLFGAKPIVDCIQSTLSSDQILAHGKHVELDVDTYLNGAGLETDETNERSLSAAEVAQKVYLAVVNGVMTVDEARDMIRDAGGNL